MLQTQKRSNEFFTDGCHVDPTAGHMGVKRTLRRINERFRWTGREKYNKLLLIRYIHAETNVNARRLLNLTSVSVQIGEFCSYCTELHSIPVSHHGMTLGLILWDQFRSHIQEISIS